MIYIIVLDGAADRKIKKLEGRTPLEYAKTQGLDMLASKSCMSMISVIGEGIPPESDSGTMALLSYDPLIFYPGRGPLEGMGTGMAEGYDYSASFRINFASYDADRRFLDRRTARGLSNAELQALALELNENVRIGVPGEEIAVKLKAFGHHRGILSLVSRKTKLSGNVSNTDPGFQKEGCFSLPVPDYDRRPLCCKPMDDTLEAKRTARLVNEFSAQAAEILAHSSVNRQRRKRELLAANYILVRDGGGLPKDLPAFTQKFGWSLSMFGQLPAEQAIADLIQGRFYYTRALELQLDPQYLQKAAADLIKEPSDVKYIHLKGPDEPGHDQKPLEKARAIEIIDRFFVGEVLSHIRPDDYVAVTCDHATPCELGIHSADPVPLMICGPGIRPDGRKRFTEDDAFRGSCPVKEAKDLLPFIAEKQEK